MKAIFFSLLLLLSATAQSEFVMEIITIYNRPASDLKPLLTPLLEPGDSVIANGSDLIVKTTSNRLNNIQKIIAQLDTVLENLLITVVQGKDISADAFNSAAQLTGEYSNQGLNTKQLRLQARVRQTNSNNLTHATQKINTLDGQSATIRVGEASPLQNVQIAPSRHGYPVYSTHTDYIETSTGFNVTPRLVGKNQVIISVSPWSDRINANQIETQAAQTTLRAKLGEWIELGSHNEMSQSRKTGLVSEIRRTQSKNNQILIKVEKQ